MIDVSCTRCRPGISDVYQGMNEKKVIFDLQLPPGTVIKQPLLNASFSRSREKNLSENNWTFTN